MAASQATNANNSHDGISLEELGFVGATFFVVGASISLYIAYQRLKESESSSSRGGRGGLIE